MRGCGVRRPNPSACGTQGGSGRSPPYPLGASLRLLVLDFGLRPAESGIFILDSGDLSNKKGGAEQMAAKAGARIKITLRCSECKQRNYNTFKNKKNTPDRLELNKYCPFCRKHTVHNETK